MDGIFFSHPQLLWLLPLVMIAGGLLLRRGKNRLLVVSRIVVVCLLVVALANPYVVAEHSKEVKRPRVTILADQTGSTEIFDWQAAERMAAALPDSALRYFSGESTPLGEKVLQYAPQADTLLLVTDGYSTSGRPLAEAIALARSSNATVFALEQVPVQGEVGVEIQGTGTAVQGGDYPFKVLVRSAGPEGFSAQGTLEVFVDDSSIYSGDLAHANGSLRMSHRFASTKTHLIRAVVDPSSDHQPQNNQFSRAVYVVPKPPVLLVSAKPSPLSTILSSLFQLTTAAELPSDLDGFKAVVLDDQRYRSDLNRLREYVREGGGLVVVGGPSTFELGGFYKTPFESALPVISAPSRFEGGKVMVVVMDISGSTMTPMRQGQAATYLDYEKSLAIELLRSPELRDAQAAVVVFGTKAYVVTYPVPLARSRTVLEDDIKSLQTPIGKDETNLDDGLGLAWQIINASQTEAELVVISDGRLEPDKLKGDSVFIHSSELIKEMNVTTTMIQVQAFDGSGGRLDALAAETGSVFYPAIYPSTLTIRTAEEMPVQTEEEESVPTDSGYGLIIANSDHYITRDIDLNVSVNGFNDVTPRTGAQRLVVMPDGKPILTAMRYGLGRSVALSTDDGSSWAGNLYGAESSMLISSMTNWAVGDPRPEAERIDAEDGWKGSALELIITSSRPPKIDMQGVNVESAGEGRYTATLTPNSTGLYYIGDFGFFVNYPLEYREMGVNPGLRDAVEANGGRVFTEDEARMNLVEAARQASQRRVEERVSRQGTLLLLALAIFLAEVVLRRLRELKSRLRRI